ncbi:hypothetical protein Syun_005676 [Stephania yunnanensis]|uniref:NAD(P)-binding domain-containing protein n=1 Tax=Stephania yunnanensis TaxID=152371 RepID=A0AAP0L9C8_9MAGN
MGDKKETVCVTGAGGYQASWLVKLLLLRGYKVHGTVRDPSDDGKNGHLKKLANAAENLQLFKVDVLDFESLCEAIDGCAGVFHTACPVPYSSDLQDPQYPWFKWYSYAKTEAEIRAFEYAKENGLDLVTICPSLILGPLLRPAMNIASELLLSFARDGLEKVENNIDFMAVDVRDVAEALLLVYEKPEANGRYICAAYPAPLSVLVDKMKTFYPNLNYPKQISEQGFARKLSSEKLERLGWKYRALEETIVDSIEDFYEKGLLDRQAYY